MNTKLVDKTTEKPLTRGALLPNGAIIIDFACFATDQRPDGLVKHGRVLALRTESPDPFVVWFYVEHPDHSLYTHGGHYYDQLEPALADMKST